MLSRRSDAAQSRSLERGRFAGSIVDSAGVAAIMESMPCRMVNSCWQGGLRSPGLSWSATGAARRAAGGERVQYERISCNPLYLAWYLLNVPHCLLGRKRAYSIGKKGCRQRIIISLSAGRTAPAGLTQGSVEKCRASTGEAALQQCRGGKMALACSQFLSFFPNSQLKDETVRREMLAQVIVPEMPSGNA